MIDFREAYAAWLRTKAESFAGKSKDDIDAVVTDLYDVWLNTPQDVFHGKIPLHYFDGFDSEALIDALLAYALQNIPIPDPLCDAIMEDVACAPLLVDALDEPLTAQQNLAVLERLSELQEEEMIAPCMRLVMGQDDEKADQAVQAVMVFGQNIAKMALDQMRREGLSDKVLDRLADIVSTCGPCQGAYERLSALFCQRKEAKAFYAQCLVKLGDERALPILLQAARHPELTYYDYTAIRDAIEALGGELIDVREFFDDQDYILLQDLDD